MFVVGCPIQKREWMLPRWFEHTEAALADFDHIYAFVLDRYEEPLNEVIQAEAQKHNLAWITRHVDEKPREDKRVWGADRYHRMVFLRNQLLELVRLEQPEYFLSLDSDILLAPEAVKGMLEGIEEGFDAVGGKAYMTTTTRSHPSYANLGRRNDNLRREDSEFLVGVDCIMAIKLMTPKAYNVDYEWHAKGEDIGWSKAAKKAGLLLGWDGRTVNKHVMSPEWLYKEDPRCPII